MVKHRPRVAMVAYTIYKPDARVRRHVNALHGAGYDVDVYALMSPDGVPDPDTEGVTFHLPRRRVSRASGKLGVFRDYVMFTMACLWLLQKHHWHGPRFSVVHVNNMPNFLVFAALPLKLLGVPVLLDIHDTMPEIYQDKFNVTASHPAIRALFIEEKASIRQANFVMTTEHTKWERLLSNGLGRDRSCVTLNLPDSDIFPPDSLAGKQPLPDEEFRLVYHGTLAHRLGMDLAIRAVSLLRDRLPNVRLDIIGDGEQRASLVELTNELQLRSHVRFSDGFIPMEALTAALNGAHLAVIPSRNSIGTSLMLPTKLLEYARLGIPAVTVATPTILRYFDDTMVHFAKSEDPADLAEHILALYSAPEQRDRLAQMARRFYERYSFEGERAKYLGIIADLVAHKLPRCPEEPAA